RFAGALRIPTVSYDKYRGVPPDDSDDTDHAGFPAMHAYFERQFPHVHAQLERTIVNKYSLLYVWHGTGGADADAAPLMLCSHMDVVPVLEATRDEWVHAPFSGDVADGYVWGRGAADTKSTLLGILEAVEALLVGGFAPSKTVILAFGHDEELSGAVGAKSIYRKLSELGYDGKIGMLIDEGTSLGVLFGVEFASVAIAEKGYIDIELEVETPGGHASMPERHTGIGFMSQAITALEAHPFAPKLTDDNPYLTALQCATTYGDPAQVDPVLAWALRHLPATRGALERYLDSERTARPFVATSQAVDIVQGGAKVNALPERVMAAVNHRVALHQRTADVERAVVARLRPVVAVAGLNLTATDVDGRVYAAIEAGPRAAGALRVRSVVALETAPVSPSAGAAWEVLSGTIRHALAAATDGVEGGTPPVVTPMLMPANTDTRHYWNLTPNIYRFSPVRGGEGIHTVNERVLVSGYLDNVKFYHELVRNWDEAAAKVVVKAA
ncbi:hypothetical protein HK405_012353, partial [Cladochytrium tenue]